MFYYYEKTEIQKGLLFCVYQSETKLTQKEIDNINKTQNNLLNNTVIYQGETPFFGYPILSGETIRPATDKELVELNKLELGEGEILVGDTINKIPQPSWKYKWDFLQLKWIPDEDKLVDGEYINGSDIIIVPKLTNVISQEWDKVKHIWIETTTDLEKVQNQYREYTGMDTPTTLEEMKQQNPALVTEYINMMINLRKLIYSLKPNKARTMNLSVTSPIEIPKPSLELITFKENFEKIGG